MAIMFSDMELSKELMRGYRDTAAEIRECYGVEFTAEVLSQGHWPEQSRLVCSLPPELKTVTDNFEAFYA